MDLDFFKYDHLIEFEITVGTTLIKTFHFQTENKHTKWCVKEKRIFNEITQPFAVKIRKSITERQVLLIKYSPTIPDEKNIIFYIIELPEKNIILRVHGLSKGVKIQTSVKSLEFYRFKNCNRTKLKFELQNVSDTAVPFLFDYDNGQNIFHLEPTSGIIEPKKYFYILIQFVAENTGLYYIDLACLFLNQPPLFVKLFGMNSKTANINILNKLKIRCTDKGYGLGFEKYMSDYIPTVTSDQVCKIAKHNFDFNLENNRTNIYTEISNCSDKCLRVNWHTDENESPFILKHTKRILNPSEKHVILVEFNPQIAESLFGGHIYGQALLYESTEYNSGSPLEDVMEILVPLRLRLIGSSFVGNSGWYPNINIDPKVICMPICYSETPVYRTFQITKNGAFPVTFKFKPPANTYFHVRPSLGIIKDQHHLFVVKFNPKNLVSSICTETWEIQLNEMDHVMTQITFKAIKEPVNVVVGEDDKIYFGSLFPGCKKYIDVPVYNLSQCSVSVQFFDDKYIKVEKNVIVVECFDYKIIKMCYKADCDVPKNVKLQYEVSILYDRSLIIGTSISKFVTAFVDSNFSKLCSSPNYHNFGEVVCGQQETVTFTLFNFGNSELNFILKCYEHYGNNNEIPFTIEPTKGILKPQESMLVTVSLITLTPTVASYCIQYHITSSESSEDVIIQEGKSLLVKGIVFKMDYYSFYPTLKFVDIGKNATGPLFGKLNIWEFFQIDEMNNILKELKANESRQITIRVPEAQIGRSIVRTIVFIIKNLSNVDTTCQFIRKKMCDCVKKIVPNTITFRQFTYSHCPHRQIFEINPSNDVIKANSTMFLTMTISYNIEGIQQMCYIMNLSHNRSIEIFFNITSVNPGQLNTDIIGFNFRLHDVFIGEMNPHIQFYPIINTTTDVASYVVDTEPLEKLNKIMGFDLLTCLNPIENVSAKSIHYIMFRFSPLSLGALKISLPFVLGQEEAVLNIEGEAVMKYESPIQTKTYFDDIEEYYYYPDLLVHISTENVIIEEMPTHSVTRRLFTLRNVSKTRSIGFWFASQYIENVLYTYVNPSTGLLKPKSFTSLLLIVTSFKLPCSLRISCPCHLIDQTTLKEHMETSMEYHKEATNTNDLFEIVDGKRIVYEKPTINVTPPPKIFHRNISITCNIIDYQDIELKVSVKGMLKFLPYQEISLYRKNCENTFMLESHEDILKRKKNWYEKKEKQLLPHQHLQKKNVCYNYDFNPKSSTENIFINVDQINSEIEADFEAQLNQEPPELQDMCTPYKCCIVINDKQFYEIHTALECMLSDIVFSKRFKHQIEHQMRHEPHIYYNEFRRDSLTSTNKQEMSKLLLNQIPVNLLAETIQIFIGDAVMKHFQLGTYPNIVSSCGVHSHKLETNKSIGKNMYTEKFLFILDSL